MTPAQVTAVIVAACLAPACRAALELVTADSDVDAVWRSVDRNAATPLMYREEG